MFCSIDEAFIEPFEQQNHEKTFSTKSLINKSKDDEMTVEAIFCEKGHKYEEGECRICEPGKFQDYDKPHRKTECKTQPELKPTDCADGEYFFKTEDEKKEIYDKTKHRELNTGDFCKPHEPFGPKNCAANTYLVAENAPKLRKDVKDKKLSKTDYCEAQPGFQTITCSKNGFFENKTLYDEIINARAQKATGDNICSSTAISYQKVEVHHTHFDAKKNKRSFRTLKVTGKVNNAGKVSLKPTAQREIVTMKTPKSANHRTSSSAWGGAKNGHGCNDGELDKGGWCSQHNKAGQWYQLDIEKDTIVAGVVTQGRNCCAQWVKTFKVMAKKNEGDWFWVDNQNVYNGNFDQNTKVISDFKNPIVARYIRIYPQSWNRHMSMRCDVRCANLRAIANATETTVNVGKNAVFNITRTEPAIGLYYFDIIFTDAYKNRASKIGTVEDAYLYDFQFSLNRHAQHVRKGSNNYQHPNGFGENIGSITSSSFNKNSVTVQNIKYTARDQRSGYTLEQIYKATVYTVAATIKAHATQNTKYGHDHHAPQFSTTNMTVKYIGGMPGKNSIHGNAHTFTGHYQATDNYDSSHKINLYPKVTKYKHAWPSWKDITIRRYNGYHWHHHVTHWGINSDITHAQYNWHPHHNIDNNWIKNHIHNRTLRFHARNKYNHSEGKWFHLRVNVLSDTYRVNVRAYLRHKHYGAGNVNCDMQIRNHHNHHFATCQFNTHHGHQHKPWCAYDIKHGQRMRVTLNEHCHGEEHYTTYATDTGWVSSAKNITQHVDVHNSPAVKRKKDHDAKVAKDKADALAAALKLQKDIIDKQRRRFSRRVRGTPSPPPPTKKPARRRRRRH